MGRLDDALLPIFAPRIVLDVSPSFFTFSSRLRTEQLETILNVELRDGRHQIISVGCDAPATIDVLRIHLFSPPDAPTPERGNTDYLNTFVKYGFVLVSSRYALVNPAVVVRNIDSLQPLLNGSQRAVILQAIEKAGARTIEFE